MMTASIVQIPHFSIVALIGVTGAGKTSFARKHFKPTQILTSDHFRALVSDSENDMEASQDAFDLLYTVTRKRLSRRLLTVIDATNLQDYAQERILNIASEFGAHSVAVVLDVPEEESVRRTLMRMDRPFGAEVVRLHVREFRETMKLLHTENFHNIFHLKGVEAISSATVQIGPSLSPDEKLSFTPVQQHSLA